MISARLMPAACVCLALALVPTLIHSYAGEPSGDGRAAAAVPATLGEFRSVASDRGADWGRRRFDSDDWIERDYSNGSPRLRLTVVRSYDPKSLYHHPELAVAYGQPFEPVHTRALASRPDIPVHVLEPGPDGEARGLYVLHYTDRFVDDPLMFQVRTAGELLVSRRKPMTMFFVLDEAATGSEQRQRDAEGLLLAAVDSFLK